MKNIVISLLVIVIISTNSYSQAYRTYKPLKLGLKASPNIGWLNPDTKGYENDGIRIGFSYGLIADFRLAENYYIGSGLFISHFGGKISMPAPEDDTENDSHWRLYKLQYLDTPLTLKLLTNEIGYTTYFGQFGIGLGANMSAKGEDRFISTTNGSTDLNPDIKSDISFLRASLIVGAGLEYSLADNASIIIGIEYNNGFTNLIKSKPENVSKHNVTVDYIQLTIGIIF